jgi:hypothetical protein
MTNAREQLAGSCKYFTGVHNKVCGAGVRYEETPVPTGRGLHFISSCPDSCAHRRELGEASLLAHILRQRGPLWQRLASELERLHKDGRSYEDLATDVLFEVRMALALRA